MQKTVFVIFSILFLSVYVANNGVDAAPRQKRLFFGSFIEFYKGEKLQCIIQCLQDHPEWDIFHDETNYQKLARCSEDCGKRVSSKPKY